MKRYLPISSETFTNFMHEMKFVKIPSHGEMVFERIIPDSLESIRVCSGITEDAQTNYGRNSIRILLVEASTGTPLTVPVSVRRGSNTFPHIRYHIGKLWKQSINQKNIEA